MRGNAGFLVSLRRLCTCSSNRNRTGTQQRAKMWRRRPFCFLLSADTKVRPVSVRRCLVLSRSLVSLARFTLPNYHRKGFQRKQEAAGPTSFPLKDTCCFACFFLSFFFYLPHPPRLHPHSPIKKNLITLLCLTLQPFVINRST